MITVSIILIHFGMVLIHFVSHRDGFIHEPGRGIDLDKANRAPEVWGEFPFQLCFNLSLSALLCCCLRSVLHCTLIRVCHLCWLISTFENLEIRVSDLPSTLGCWGSVLQEWENGLQTLTKIVVYAERALFHSHLNKLFQIISCYNTF